MINQAAINLIKHYESLHDGDLSVIGLQPKRCPAGIWTIGYGHALKNEDGVLLRRNADKEEAYNQAGNLTQAQAEEILNADLVLFEKAVSGMVRVPLNANELGALVSMAYNIGTAALKNSTLLQHLNIGDKKGAANQFLAWDKATVRGVKVVLAGLTARRKAERELFLS